MLQDGQGSTRQLLNSSQTVVASYISDAFGNSVGGSESSANPFIWNGGSGYYSDAESGLQKVGARFYDPAVGRWISQDTEIVAGSAADSQALNRYAYCEGNPVGASDPSGHDGILEVVQTFVEGWIEKYGWANGIVRLVTLPIVIGVLIVLGIRKWHEHYQSAPADTAGGQILNDKNRNDANNGFTNDVVRHPVTAQFLLQQQMRSRR